MYDDEFGTKKNEIQSRITLNHGNYLSDYLENYNKHLFCMILTISFLSFLKLDFVCRNF